MSLSFSGEFPNLKFDMVKAIESEEQPTTPFVTQRSDPQPVRGQPLGVSCPFPGCQEITGDIVAYQRETHVPEIFRNLGVTNEELARRRVTILRIVAISAGVGTPEALLQLVSVAIHQDINLEHYRPSLIQICQVAGWPVPMTFTVDPMNSLAILAHW
jgi:hypothetical protein